MTRAEITKFLGELLVNTRFAGAGKHWASEVSLDPWTANGKRVDYMQFSPADQMSISGIEREYLPAMRLKAAKRMFTAEMV